MPGSAWFDLEFNKLEVNNLLSSPNGLVAKSILTRAGEVVEAGATKRARVLTGRMRREMHTSMGKDSHGLFVDVGTVWYARFLEKPAKQLKRPRRALRPALRDIRKTHLGAK